MFETDCRDFTRRGYVCHVLNNGSIRIKKYIDPYDGIQLLDGVTLIIPEYIDNHPVKEIGANAFSGNNSVKSVIIPQLTSVIDTQAFSDCPRLEDVLVPSDLNKLSDDAFIGSVRLQHLTYPDGQKKSIDTLRHNSALSATESRQHTDYVYSPEWGYGRVYARESDDAIRVEFTDGSKRHLSFSYYHRKGKLIYTEKPFVSEDGVFKETQEEPQPIETPVSIASDSKNQDVGNPARKIPQDVTASGTTERYISEDGFKLSDEQIEVYELLNRTNENYLVTGKAGTGKSVLLRYFVRHTHKLTAVVAFTGVAALNANGQTIHSLFQCDPKIQYTKNRKSVESMSDAKKEVLRHLDTLVIDEISMVRSDLMDMMDQKLRFAKGVPEKPFGGCQIIAFGDLYQLAPFFSRNEHGSRYLFDTYKTLYFFGAPCIINHPLKYIELSEVRRQTNPEFIEALNVIRIGELPSSIQKVINSRVRQVPDGIQCITLTPRNDSAKNINQAALDCLQGKKYTYPATYTGKFVIDVEKGNESNLPTDIHLQLKVGAIVMMVRNDYNHKWVNGTMGVVTALSDDCIEVAVNGSKYQIEPETWQKYEYKYDPEKKKLESEEAGTFTQYPVRLAYAITINKSQGQTYDNVNIDYAGHHAFADGQTYVALSRCRTLDGIYLKQPLSGQDVRASAEVKKYIKRQLNQQSN